MALKMSRNCRCKAPGKCASFRTQMGQFAPERTSSRGRIYSPSMMTLDDVARMASELPAVTEGERSGNRTWSVAGKGFAWERPFSKADIKRFGEVTPPAGPILAVRVSDLGEKEAVLAANPNFFTIPHFAGYSAILIQLRKVSKKAVHEAIVDGWLACAPPTLADSFLIETEKHQK